MQALLEFAPLSAFLAAYYAAGLYVATAVLMVGMALLLVVDYARQRRIPRTHGLSAALVFLFGSATLLLHNQRFIQWKPTVFFWLASLAFVASFWVGERTLVQRMLGGMLGADESRVPQLIWRRLNAAWALYCALLGAVNLLVAFGASERTWVNFKVIGLTLATFLFIVPQAFWLMRRVQLEPGDPSARA